MGGRGDGEVLLRPETQPVLRDHPRAGAPRDFHGIIAAAGVDDDGLGGEARRREAFGELRGGVARDHANTQRQGRSHAAVDRGARRPVRNSDARILRALGPPAASRRRPASPRSPSPPVPPRLRSPLPVPSPRPRHERSPRHPALVARRHRARARARRRRPPAPAGPRRRLGRRGGLRAAGRAASGRAPRDSGRAATLAPTSVRRVRRGASSAPSARICGASATSAILDLQEQVKGALMAGWRAARATAPTGRAPRAARHAVPRAPPPRSARGQHFDDRCRQLAGAALGYAPSGSAALRHRRAAAAVGAAAGAALRDAVPRDQPRRQAVARGALARADRGARRRGLRGAAALGQRRRAGAQRAARRGLRRRRSSRRGSRCRRSPALVARAEGVVGVDTGLVHLAAALGTPTVALFVATDPALAGVEPQRRARARPRRRRRDAHGRGDAWRPSGRCCAPPRAADEHDDARPVLAALVARAAAAAAAAVVARPARAGLSGADRRALRALRRRPRRAARSSGCTRCRSARRAPPRRWCAGCCDALSASATVLLTHMTATGRAAGTRTLGRARGAGVAAVRRPVRGARVPPALPAASPGC